MFKALDFNNLTQLTALLTAEEVETTDVVLIREKDGRWWLFYFAAGE